MEEEAHCNCSIDCINTVGLFFLKQSVGVMYLPGSKDISTKSDRNEGVNDAG